MGVINCTELRPKFENIITQVIALTFLENKKKEEKVMTLVKFYFCKLGQNYDFK